MDTQQLKHLLRNYPNMKRRIREIDALEAVVKAAGSAARMPIDIPYFDENGEINHSCGTMTILPGTLGLDEATMTRNASEKEGLNIIVNLLEGLMACLEAPEYAVMEALYVKNMTYDEAAEAVDISRATVSTRKNKAVSELCRMMNAGRV